MKGYVHSTESFGTVDGPGSRFVVFVQGCPMRCLYCHNPDTWEMNIGNQMDTDELLEMYRRNKAFYTNGGITVTGGEPLMQIDFVTELFTKAKAEGIHTALDTSGIAYNENNQIFLEKLEKLMAATDLVMLDIKHIDPEEHKKLCKQPNEQILKFAQYLSDINKDTWIRHVVVPTITFKKNYLHDLGYFIGGLKSVKALELLPYHTMGRSKYQNLGIEYPLEGVQQMDKANIPLCKTWVLEGIKERRAELVRTN